MIVTLTGYQWLSNTQFNIKVCRGNLKYINIDKGDCLLSIAAYRQYICIKWHYYK